MLVAQTAHHHRRCSVCNRAPSSRIRLYCDGRAPLERLAKPLLRSLRQTARSAFQSGGKPTAWLSMAPSPAHSLVLEMSPLRSASAHEGKQDGAFITSKQFAPRLEWSPLNSILREIVVYLSISGAAAIALICVASCCNTLRSSGGRSTTR